ncbi:MAG: replication protein [Bacillota bacterium]|nr:replication protein [Bacillota bacterium]
MADVQLEHGYTRIANEIFDHMARIKLSPTQYRLLFVIWRYTYGFKRKEHDLSLTFLSNATGCDKRQIQRELKGLEDKKIIFQKVKNGSYRKISFNKDYGQWATVGETTIGETVNATIGETVNATIGETINQEIKNINKNLNKKDVVKGEHAVNRILDILTKSKILGEKEITEFLRDDITDVIDNFGFEQPEEMIIAAIKETARGNGKTWLYVYKKLVAWKKQGIVSLSDLEKMDSEEDKNGKKVHQYRGSSGRPPKKEKFEVFGDKVGRYGKL